MLLGAALYLISLSAQLIVVLFAISIFSRSKSYRLVCSLLLVGLVFLIGESVIKIHEGYSIGQFHMFDAWLAFLASIFLLLGVIHFKKLLIELEEKNFMLEWFSKTDELTAALSRSEAIFCAELEIKKALRIHKSIAFLMVDIDHFKFVNDSFGHSIGDQVLKNLVTICKQDLREIDIFGRVGGEEFLIVLPETNQTLAVEIADRLRIRIEESEMAAVPNNPIFITVSIGISIFEPQQGKHPEASTIVRQYYGLCDAAMYKAKAAGRNQVYCEPNFPTA